MYCKNKKQPFAENGYNEGMAVELVGICLEKSNRGEECCITGSMAAEKKDQEETAAGHDPFFAYG